jgi:hypothetical protein
VDWKKLEDQLRLSHKPVIDKTMVEELFSIEAEIAHQKGLPDYKYATNQEMLSALQVG